MNIPYFYVAALDGSADGCASDRLLSLLRLRPAAYRTLLRGREGGAETLQRKIISGPSSSTVRTMLPMSIASAEQQTTATTRDPGRTAAEPGSRSVARRSRHEPGLQPRRDDDRRYRPARSRTARWSSTASVRRSCRLALHVAKRTHAPNLVLVAGATYGVNPNPPFLTPTSNDWVIDRGAAFSLDIERTVRSRRRRADGSDVPLRPADRPVGQCNVTSLGDKELAMKLPGGGGGCNLSCDVEHVTLWTTGHRCDRPTRDKRASGWSNSCDFVTNLGHRAADGRDRGALGHRGLGPQWLVTDLGLFDFDAEGHLRLRQRLSRHHGRRGRREHRLRIRRRRDGLDRAAAGSGGYRTHSASRSACASMSKESGPQDRRRRFGVRQPEAMEASSSTMRGKADLASRRYRDRRNFVPLPYRGVSVQPYDGRDDRGRDHGASARPRGLSAHRSHRAARADDAYALSSRSAKRNNEAAVRPIDQVEVLALPERCRFVGRSGNRLRQSLGAGASWRERSGVGADRHADLSGANTTMSISSTTPTR